MTGLTQAIIDGLFLGSFYALIALGYSMVYGIIKLLNFAHGDLYMLGAFIGFAIITSLPSVQAIGNIGVLLVLLLISMLLTGGCGVLIERLAYRPLRSAPRLSVLITAVGMSFVLEYGVCQIAGPDPQAYPSWARMGGFQIPIFDAHLESSRLVLMAVAALLMFALAMYIGMTREGRAMRAIALDQKAATLMGVNVNKTISMVFFIGSALAGAAGVMAASQFGVVTFLMGFLIGIKAFTAAVIGGIGNLYGAMLGGLSLGLLENLGSFWLGGEWKDVFAFVFLILFLTLKPTGILGERVVERM